MLLGWSTLSSLFGLLLPFAVLADVTLHALDMTSQQAAFALLLLLPFLDHEVAVDADVDAPERRQTRELALLEFVGYFNEVLHRHGRLVDFLEGCLGDFL